MSTVILTPDYIAQDHTLITNVYPHETITDTNYKKIFIPEHRRFVLGITGDFRPVDIDTKSSYEVIEKVLADIISQDPDETGMVDVLKDQPHVQEFSKIITEENVVFLVTKAHRFLTYKSKKEDVLTFAYCGPLKGLGTGGPIAAGMIEGGMSIHEIWLHLHKLDHHSSSIYTAIPLDSLNDWIQPS